MRAIQMEFKKARGRFDLSVAVLIGLLALLWASRAGMRSEDELATGYSMLFYVLPIINAVVMPVGMAVLASRIWDVETKGDSCRLLFTLQERSDLFRGKLLLGLVEIALVCAVEFGGVGIIGLVRGYTERSVAGRFIWLVTGTLYVDAMLYLAGLWLSIRFASQVAALAAGILGSLSGLFAALLPEPVGFLMPWGYFIPLGPTRMLWDGQSRFARYAPVPPRFWLLGVTVLLAVLCLALGRRALMDREV